MTNQLTLDKQHTALLIMDFQNGIVANYTQNNPDILQHTAALLAAARNEKLTVIYVVVRFRAGYPEVSLRNRGFSAIRGTGRMLEGNPDTEIHAQVAPLSHEPVVVKRRVGAFSTTDLDTILKAHNITTLLLCGIATSGVVLSTVRWAADADYELVVVENCCADADEEVHRVLTQKVFPRQAIVTQSDQILEALR
jgi:nicotinamidase-related amidase